ncbi:hypothetical protein ACVWWD_005373 [Mesorhizobium sp. URHB0026]
MRVSAGHAFLKGRFSTPSSASLSNWRRTDSNLPAALQPFLFSTSAMRNKNRWILPLGVFGNSPTKSISRG